MHALLLLAKNLSAALNTMTLYLQDFPNILYYHMLITSVRKHNKGTLYFFKSVHVWPLCDPYVTNG